MTVEVRRAQPEDIAGMRHVLVTTWHATYDELYGRERVDEITGRWHAPEVLGAQLSDAMRVCLVALTYGTIVGTAAISRSCGGAVRLDRLYVLPSHQGNGIGTALLDAVIAASPVAASIDLEVEPANHAAIAFYERHGFEVTGQTTDCGGQGDGIPATKMVRPMAPISNECDEAVLTGCQEPE